MPFLVILLLHLGFIPSPNDGNPTRKLIIFSNNCRVPYFPNSVDSISIFRMQDSSLVTRVYFKVWPPKNEVELPGGTYKLVYTNDYGQPVTRTIRLYDSATEVSLCPDSLLSYPQNTLAKLKDDQRLYLGFHLSGCFADINRQLVIVNRHGTLFAELYNGPRNRSKQLLRKKTLQTSDIPAFVKFENELRFASDRCFCTTKEEYFLSSPYLSMTRKDSCCWWEGFRHLTEAWFGKF